MVNCKLLMVDCIVFEVKGEKELTSISQNESISKVCYNL